MRSFPDIPNNKIIPILKIPEPEYLVERAQHAKLPSQIKDFLEHTAIGTPSEAITKDLGVGFARMSQLAKQTLGATHLSHAVRILLDAELIKAPIEEKEYDDLGNNPQPLINLALYSLGLHVGQIANLAAILPYGRSRLEGSNKKLNTGTITNALGVARRRLKSPTTASAINAAHKIGILSLAKNRELIDPCIAFNSVTLKGQSILALKQV